MERKRAVLVCLGGGLNLTDQPTGMFRARLDMAHELFSPDNQDGVIITGKGGYRVLSHATSEAEAGRLYLEGRGIGMRYLFKEDQSRDTIGSAYFTRIRYLTSNGWLNPTIITNEFHMPRARFLFERVLDESSFTPDFISCTNGDMSDELRKWMRHEEEMLKFYQGIFAGVRRGDMVFLEDYIYHRDPAYSKTGEIDQEHQQLTERIKLIWN